MFLYRVPLRRQRLLGLVLLALAAGIGVRLYVLASREQLWGWWPLPLLLLLWGAIVAFRQNPARYTYLAIATVAGAGLGLGFGTLPTWPLQVVGFAALLVLTDRLAEDETCGLRQQWWYGYHAFVLYNVLATWWVANTALAAGIVANFLNALLMTVPWVLTYLLRRRMPNFWMAGAVVLWIGFEYLHYNWQIAWPWLTLGNALASTPKLAQWYEVTGVFGGSLYIASAGALLGRLVVRHRAQPSVRVAAMWPPATVLLVPMLVSGFLYPGEDATASAPTATVTLVQPNLEPHYVKFDLPRRERFERFDSLVASAPAGSLVVLPETSFGGIQQEELARTGPVSILAAGGGDLLVGVSSYRRYPAPIDDPALRTQEDGRGGQFYYTAHNSAVSVDGGVVEAVYDKSRLVPGVEFLPYRRALFVFEPLVESLGGTTAGLGVSDSAVVFDYASGVRAAPLICYESIYGDYVREFVLRGANLLTVPTNDGWWDDSPGHRQHLAIARLRAIETRRYVAQAANSGISAILDHRGELLAATGYDEVAALSGEVRLLGGQTLYVQYGDQLGRLAAGAAALLLLSLIGRIWQGRVGGGV